MSDLGKPIGPRREELPTQRRYSRMVLNIALSISLVSVIPLVVLTWFNYNQYRITVDASSIRPVGQITEAAWRSVDRVIAAHRGALATANLDRAPGGSSDAEDDDLRALQANLNEAFGDFVELLIVDPKGDLKLQTGESWPAGRSFADEPWFRTARNGGSYVGAIFRDASGRTILPMAVPWGDDPVAPQVMYATLNGELLSRELGLFEQDNGEAFLVDRAGRLQTPSRYFGDAPAVDVIDPPLDSTEWGVAAATTSDGQPLLVGRKPVEGTPFILVFLNHHPRPTSWFGRRLNLMLFTGISVLLIVVVVTWGSQRIGARLGRSDVRRAAMYHHLEYTNKMAAIGRLGAGVAHEINNPLAIIGEKAGLLRDLMTIPGANSATEKLLEQVDSIQTSVERCSKITHRLLGFAKHMEVMKERISLRHLLRQVLSFLDKEAGYRSINVRLDIPESLPDITSDRGQLQQVFLNIVNNAFAAVDEGGEILLTGEDTGDGFVIIHVEDDGVGISEEHLKHVFEPFYTTKAGTGTGLGLSITYGIVEKHGGSIQVSSKIGEGTRFSVRLPIVED